ncbi:MAG: Ig-like domain-containing protein [Treponema sp.]|jgi:cytoskeletal protein RodZ|nr:Ig-like domain-containing protein [Treponema sp.]
MKKMNNVPMVRIFGIIALAAMMVFTIACKKDAGRQQQPASSAAQQTQQASEAAPAPAAVAVTGVTISKTTLSLKEKATETITATAAPANAENKAVTWKSSNAAIATVDAAGKITAVKAGKATITVTTSDGGKTAACEVTVTAAAAAPAIPNGKYENEGRYGKTAYEFSGNKWKYYGGEFYEERYGGTYTAQNGILTLIRIHDEGTDTESYKYTLVGKTLTLISDYESSDFIKQ